MVEEAIDGIPLTTNYYSFAFRPSNLIFQPQSPVFTQRDHRWLFGIISKD